MSTASTSDYVRFLRGLRAIRTLQPRPLPQAAIDDIVEVGRWSGSASNKQPTEIVVVQDRATLDQLAGIAGHAKHLLGAGAAVIVVTPGDPERREHEVFDEGRLSERVMLAAAAHGLGSCIGWLVGQEVPAAAALLHIPRDCRLRTIISIGYVDEEARRAKAKNPEPRKAPSAFVHWERYTEE